MPIQPLATQQSTDFGSVSVEYPCADGGSPELQRAMLGQQLQLQPLGPGLLSQAPDGLMIARPAQTLTDTLDDIMSGVCRPSPVTLTDKAVA